ncbi:MAG: hypothetical protein J2P28_05470 [Actinobacteria bacterium]|nr:hypothetical protein [Actinomycetota bacterium]MBO0834956.1 hypothetical protein [Actinomycetota bacterium]
MSSPTEQLIRQYLNQLTLAARDRLGPDERQALVNRTRQLIEQKADMPSRPTALEVGRVIAQLGDPAALVDQELRRLAATRGQPDTLPNRAGQVLPDAPPMPAGTRKSARRARPSSRGFLDRVLRRDPADVPRSARPDYTSEVAVIKVNVEQSNGDTATTGDEAQAPSIASVPPATIPLEPKWPTVVLNGRALAAQNRPETASPVTDNTISVPARPAVRTSTGRLLAMLASWAARRPLEALAVILLGFGGAIYPPVYLLGAVVALGSRLWDYRDKWTGLTVPPILTVIGMAIGVAVGGRTHGLHEGWVYLNVTSRLAAVLGAGYLAWRSAHGRRPPPVPPWNKPHRFG